MMPSTKAAAAPDRFWRVGWLVLLPALLLGCTATKSTVYFAKAEQALYEARVLEAEVWAPYMWTRANETMKKSREEWAYADFGAAEQLAIEAAELAERATKRAQDNRATGVIPGQMRELPTAAAPASAPATSAPAEAPVTNPTPTPWGG
ncbi:MAG: hypothetical protein CL927_06530 [Deltaproteobacteria bacterium]|nr:hypothetical protein [Deltaproteobacteria bacterium]HCH66065.1 hypothetical protein [Deltaproteobacteria bacterium]